MAGRSATGEKVLGLMAADGGRIHIGMVAQEVGSGAYQAAQRLKDKGLVKAERRGWYKVTAEGRRLSGKPLLSRGSANNPANNLRARAWRALRMRRACTIKEILRLATEQGGDESSHTNVGVYFRYLWRAGIVSRRRTGRDYTWRLIRDLGPKNPQLHKTHLAFTDPNSGEVILVNKAVAEKDWLPLLKNAVDSMGSKAVVAKHLGVSRTVIARVLAGGYRGRMDSVAAKVIAAFGGRDG